MRTKVDALQLGAWMFVGKSRSIPLTVFRMDDHSYRTLVDWTRAKTGRDDEHATAVLRGLHEIISLFVPDTLFVAVGRSGLEITFSGVDLKDEGRRGRVRFALSTWLGVIYPDPGHRPAQRAHVADSALKADNWRVVEASTTLRGRGPHVCDAPEDTGLWNAVAARCVSALAGATVVFPSGRSKRLVPTVPTAGYDGIELIAFPPNQSVEKPGGYWTEVLTIDCASFPERDGIHILAHPSLRNWGEVRNAKRRPFRSLDVFLPQVSDLESFGPQRHGAFPVEVAATRSGAGWLHITKWKERDDENVFGVIARLTGLVLPQTEGTLKPAILPEGVWLMPRLGSVHGDKNLAGGTGLPMPDKRALCEAVGTAIQPLGFEQLPPLQRYTKRSPKPAALFGLREADEDFAAGRAALSRVLRVVNDIAPDAPVVLDLFVFGVRDEAVVLVRTAVSDVLGEPEADGDLMRWPDGFAIRFHEFPADALAEAMYGYTEPTSEERVHFPTKYKWVAEQRQRQETENAKRRQRMERHVAAARAGVDGICCAILEIPEEFQGRYHDPYLTARQVLARANVLPQVCLVNWPGAQQDETDRHRYEAAFSDLIRALGVVPMTEGIGHKVGALTTVQVNWERRAGIQIDSQAVPLAAHVRDGVLYAASPGRDSLPVWAPYPVVCLAMMTGEHLKFARSRVPENQTRFANFWVQAIQDIENNGGGLVLVDAVTGRQRLGSASNQNLVFDRLDVGAGNTPLLPSDVPHVSMARVTHQDAKLPTYYHNEDAGWVSGIFAWPGSTRTAFGLKPKPSTHTGARKAIVTTSRHADVAGEWGVRESADRKYAAIDETCAFFLQHADDPWRLIHLVQALRAVHAQYEGHTSLPYPLHELRLLRYAITG